MPDSPELKPKKSSRNIFFVGLLSFFGGISLDIFTPILPLYLTSVLGLSKEFIGLAEGLASSSNSIFKIVAGFLSDRFKKNKPIMFAGYTFSLVGRFFLAFVSTTAGVLGLRFTDGIGRGVKDPPKDVLIAASAGAETRGRSFGIVRALDTLGSVAGPLLLFLLLYFLKNNTFKYHYIFLLSAIPLVVTLSILTFFVREAPSSKQEAAVADLYKPKLPRQFYVFLAITTIFALGNPSDAFLILRANSVGVALLAIPLVYALFNFIYASASIPLGSLSDKIGRKKVILLGWVAYTLAYLGFAFADKSYQIWLLFAFYGIYYATTEGVGKALVADITISEHRGRAFGIYNAVIGAMALPAGALAGLLWDKISPAAPFFFGSLLSALAVILLIVFLRQKSMTKS